MPPIISPSRGDNIMKKIHESRAVTVLTAANEAASSRVAAI